MRLLRARTFVVFSAHAEVVPKGLGMGTVAVSILRARGGSSKDWYYEIRKVKYSPRTRR